MKSTRYLSLSIQAINVFITSLQLIFIPNVLLGTLGFEPTSEILDKSIWCRTDCRLPWFIMTS